MSWNYFAASLVKIQNIKSGRKLYLPEKISRTRNRWFSTLVAWRPFQLQPRQTTHHFAWLFPASGTAHIFDQFADTNARRDRVVIASKRPVGAAKKCWCERQVDVIEASGCAGVHPFAVLPQTVYNTPKTLRGNAYDYRQLLTLTCIYIPTNGCNWHLCRLH